MQTPIAWANKTYEETDCNRTQFSHPCLRVTESEIYIHDKYLRHISYSLYRTRTILSYDGFYLCTSPWVLPCSGDENSSIHRFILILHQSQLKKRSKCYSISFPLQNSKCHKTLGEEDDGPWNTQDTAPQRTLPTA